MVTVIGSGRRRRRSRFRESTTLKSVLRPAFFRLLVQLLIVLDEWNYVVSLYLHLILAIGLSDFFPFFYFVSDVSEVIREVFTS